MKIDSKWSKIFTSNSTLAKRWPSCTKLQSLSFPSCFPFFDGEKGYSWGGRMRWNLFRSKYWDCISSYLVGVFVCQKFELKCPSVQPSCHLHMDFDFHNGTVLLRYSFHAWLPFVTKTVCMPQSFKHINWFAYL